MKILHCFYDMEKSPCSYDFFTFLYSAEICRKRRGLNSIKLMVVHGNDDLFRLDNIRSQEQNKQFFQNVIIPGISLLPHCESFMWVARKDLTKQELDPTYVFPRGYVPQNPVAAYVGDDLVSCLIREDMPSFLTAPNYAKKLAQEFIDSVSDGKPVITLTTREIGRDDINKKRKILQHVWKEALHRLKNEFTPVIVRDTYFCNQPPLIDGIVECPQASIHLPLRMALYEKSFLNFTKNCGPAVLTLYGKTNVVYFNSFDNEVHATSQAWYESVYGITAGGCFPMTTISKRFCWDEESVSAILSLTMDTNLELLESMSTNKLNRLEDITLSVLTATRYLIRSIRRNVLPEDVLLYKKISEIIDKHGIKFNLEQSLIKIDETICPEDMISTLIKRGKSI